MDGTFTTNDGVRLLVGHSIDGTDGELRTLVLEADRRVADLLATFLAT
jgi:hypothetical protein